MDLGCHIDGYIAVAARTCVVKESPDAEAPPINEELGTVAVAAYNTMLVAAASITAGTKNLGVTAAVERVAKAYGITPISLVQMHQMKRYVLDCVKEVALKAPQPEDALTSAMCVLAHFVQLQSNIETKVLTGSTGGTCGSLLDAVMRKAITLGPDCVVQ